MNSADLIVGATYSGKRPDSGERTIQWLRDGVICYSGTTLAYGVRFPTLPVWQFLFWAKECVSFPDGYIFAAQEPEIVIPEERKPMRKRRRRNVPLAGDSDD